MAYDMVLEAITSVAVRIFGKVIILLGENVIGDITAILSGVNNGSIVTPVPNIRTASPPLSLTRVTTLKLLTPFNEQVNVPLIVDVPLKNGGDMIFVGVTVCIKLLTDAGMTDGLVKGMTIPFG